MIDFHSHILPGIDDGSKNLEQSIAMVNEAKKVGFTKIISTSHYMENYYECNEKNRKELLEQVQKNVNGIELCLGNEIYITNNIIELLQNGQASSINGTKYVLFEFPLITTRPMNDKEVIYRLVENGYIPIIAHPERYPFIQENPDYLFELEEMGALFQANYGSIIGMYGLKAKKTLKILLKNNLISFFGSDVHRPEQVYNKMPKIIKKLKKIISNEEFEEFTEINLEKVLKNENIIK
mgnify:FL=1